MLEAIVVTQHYSPELVGSAPFCADLAEWLAQSGMPTTVLTAWPHYPDVEAFPGYRNGACRREIIGGVEVERVGMWVPRRRSPLARIASELTFFLRGCTALLTRRIARRQL